MRFKSNQVMTTTFPIEFGEGKKFYEIFIHFMVRAIFELKLLPVLGKRVSVSIEGLY